MPYLRSKSRSYSRYRAPVRRTGYTARRVSTRAYPSRALYQRTTGRFAAFRSRTTRRKTTTRRTTRRYGRGIRRRRTVGRGRTHRRTRKHTRRTYRRKTHHRTRRSGTAVPFYRAGGKKPSTSFKAKVQASISDPVEFTQTTGNVSIGTNSATYATARFFQPHSIGNTAAGLLPTDATQTPYYLYNYVVVAAIYNQLYNNLGVTGQTMNQTISVSGHMEYVIRNQTNDQVPVEVYRWTVKKMPSRGEMAITEYNDPLYSTQPIFSGNPFNLIGRAIVEGNRAPLTSNGKLDALNDFMGNAELTIKELELFNKYFEWKMFRIVMKPGHRRTFTVGKKMLLINSLENFQYRLDPVTPFAPLPFTDQRTWTNAFIPGSTGLFFRQFGTPGVFGSGLAKDDNSPITYSRPEITLLTKTSYTVYDWIGLPETQGHYFVPDTGIVTNNNTNVQVSIVTEQAVQQNIVNAS